MADTKYKPGGFNNLGATPGSISGILDTFKPKNPVTPFNWSSTPQPTGVIKKVKNADGSEIHYDNTVSQTKTDSAKKDTTNNLSLGNNPGLINNSTQSNAVNSYDKSTGLYSSGNASQVAPVTTTPQTPITPPAQVTPVPTVGSTATGLIDTTKTAQNIADEAQRKYEEAGRVGARAGAGYLTSGLTTPVAQGAAAVAANLAANQQKAIAEGANIGLQGVGAQQAGFEKAGGLISPIQVPYSNQIINPSTGQPMGGTTGNAQNDITNLATQLASGASGLSYDQALSQLSGYGVAIQNRLLPEILKLNPNFNIAQSNAQAIAQGANLTNMKIAETAAKGIKDTIKQHLIDNPQLNPSDLTFANSISQWASGQQLGDPKYQTLANYLNEYISTLAPILGVGGNVTNLKTEIAQSFINAQAGGQSISQVLDGIDKLASDKIKNIESASKGGGQVAGGTPQSTGTLTWDNI